MKRFSNASYGALLALIVLFIGSALLQPDVFLKPDNLRNLLNQNAATGIVAIGMTLVIISGGIDLSVGAMLALLGGLGVLMVNKAVGTGPDALMPTILAGLTCLCGGVVLGAIQGLIVGYGKVAPFVATLVGLMTFRSVILAISNGGEIRSMSSDYFTRLGQGGISVPGLTDTVGRPLQLNYSIFLFFIIAIVTGVLLNKTRFGRHLVAVGANERAALYSAVNVNIIKLGAYAFLGLCVGVAAWITASRMNSVASASVGLFMELDAIAAVVVGGTSLRGGNGRVWGTVVGVLILGIITNILVVKGVSVYWQGVVKGAIILFAVLLQRQHASE